MTHEGPPVVLTVDQGLATVELDRPASGNALDASMAAALSAALDEVASADDIGCLLLLGRGRVFCGGGDIASMARATDREAVLRGLAGAAHAVVTRLVGLGRPVVAGIQGAAAGAGLALTLAADVVVAEASTRLLTAYAGIGLTPDSGTSWLLPRTIGLRRALDLTLTQRVLTAQEALDWGLVTRVCADGEVVAESTALARSLAAGPREALGLTRRLVRDSAQRPLAEHLEVEADAIARIGAGDEAGALIADFVSRRRAPHTPPRR